MMQYEEIFSKIFVMSLLHIIVIVNHCPSTYIRIIVLYLVSLYLSKIADWLLKARVKQILQSENVFRNLNLVSFTELCFPRKNA